MKEGYWPGIAYPRVPGHEVAGVIDAVGSGVSARNVGQRVGVGWFGGHCAQCDACRRGHFIFCRNMPICGISYDGGVGTTCWRQRVLWLAFPTVCLPMTPGP